MISQLSQLPENKKIYFASDFHLGVPTETQSKERELKIIRWLTDIEKDAHAIILLGDIFDFWFEYKYVVPKGFVRLLGKLAELSDNGVNVMFFTGNHDMWMFDYFPRELNIPVHRNAQSAQVNQKRLYIGHGDGLGDQDWSYKLLKVLFSSPLCQWAFAHIHPNLGMRLAKYWSKKSRQKSDSELSEPINPENEKLLKYCQQVEAKTHHDFYVFGHRHLALDLEVNPQSRYINIGEWVDQHTYGEFDGNNFRLLHFEK